MEREAKTRSVSRLRPLYVPLAVVVVLVLVAGGLRWAWSDGRLNAIICDGDCGDEYVIPPTGLRAGDVARPSTDREPPADIDLDEVLAAARPALRDRLLGDHVGVAVAGVSPRSDVAVQGDDLFVPASTTKVLTAYAALRAIEPTQRFTTRVVESDGTVVLVGGGDPYLTDRRGDGDARVYRATLADLAQRTAKALKAEGRTEVRLGYDASLFEGPEINPEWQSTYVPENVVTPISALWIDRGVQPNGVRTRTPAQTATARFAELLADRGIEVTRQTGSVRTNTSATPLAKAESATLSQIVEQVVRTSDNEGAEVVGRQLAIATGEPATFAGAASAVEQGVTDAGADAKGLTLDDTSGLARGNRIAPRTLVEVVRLAYAQSRTAAAVDDLPVSGFTGTLAARFTGASVGVVRAKTGTLKRVHSLAGVVNLPDGRPVVFAVMTDRSDDDQAFAAQAAVDRVAAAMAACTCR